MRVVETPRAGRPCFRDRHRDKTPKDEGEGEFLDETISSSVRHGCRQSRAISAPSRSSKPTPAGGSSAYRDADLSGHPLWLAHYTRRESRRSPSPWTHFAIWHAAQRIGVRIGGHNRNFNRCPHSTRYDRSFTHRARTRPHGRSGWRLQKHLKQWSKPSSAGHLVENDFFGKNTRAAGGSVQRPPGSTMTEMSATNTWECTSAQVAARSETCSAPRVLSPRPMRTRLVTGPFGTLRTTPARRLKASARAETSWPTRTCPPLGSILACNVLRAIF